MDSYKVTPRDLFGSSVHYQIPHFQRAYVWKQDIHWAPLWHDLIAVTRHGDRADQSEHFFGTIVLKQLHSGPGRPQKRMIVDGQQRLTTLQIIFAAIRKCFSRLGLLSDPANVDLAHALDGYLTNGREDLGDENYKIRHVGLDFGAFKSLLSTDEPSDTSTPFHKCLEYYCERIGEYLSPPDDRVVRERAHSLVSAVSESFLLFSLNLVRTENEYLIYETLNARGEALTEWDKAKNHLLAKYADASVSENRGDADRYYYNHFDEYDSDAWWRQDAKQPRFVGNRISLLLNHWLKIRLGNHIPHNLSYHYLTRDIRECVGLESVVTVAESLRQFAGIFRELESWPEDMSVMGLFQYRRRILRVGSVVPVMMVLRQRLGDSDGFEQGALAIESFLLRRLLLGYTGWHYDEVFLDVLRQVCESSEERAIGMILDVLDSSRCDWPDDDEVIHAVVNREVRMSAARLRMVLEAIETHLIPPMAGRQDVPAKLWIEHIMPKKWEAGWPLPIVSEEAKARREHSVQTLGNLTLTTAKLDIGLSNRPWEWKRGRLRANDNLFLNKQLLDDIGDHQWDEDAIAARGKRLGETICRIWPDRGQLRRDFKLV